MGVEWVRPEDLKVGDVVVLADVPGSSKVRVRDIGEYPKGRLFAGKLLAEGDFCVSFRVSSRVARVGRC